MFVPCEQCPLRRKPLFRPLTEIELGFVGEMKTDHIVVPPRTDIIREDEIGGPVYTLFEGWAVRYYILPNGARQILDVVLPGDMIGLASWFSAGSSIPFRRSPRSRSVSCRAVASRNCSPTTPRWRSIFCRHGSRRSSGWTFASRCSGAATPSIGLPI